VAGKKGRVFFSEEKKQKTFTFSAASGLAPSRNGDAGGGIKVFWFFFSKKNALPKTYR
jgi:hypothetical protein